MASLHYSHSSQVLSTKFPEQMELHICSRMDFLHHTLKPGTCGGLGCESQSGEETDHKFLHLTPIAQCKVVITFNQGLRGGRVVQLKKIVDEAIKVCPSVQHVLVAHRTDNKVHMGHLDVSLEQVSLSFFV